MKPGKIRALRHRMKLTQSEFGTALADAEVTIRFGDLRRRWTAQVVSDYEHARRAPDDLVAQALAALAAKNPR